MSGRWLVPGSMGAIECAVDAAIERERAAGADAGAIRRLLAARWLGRPPAGVGRVWWALRLAFGKDVLP